MKNIEKPYFVFIRKVHQIYLDSNYTKKITVGVIYKNFNNLETSRMKQIIDLYKSQNGIS